MSKTIDSFDGDYNFLSNFFPCKVKYEGLEYPSVEHAYQSAKAVDKALREPFTVSGTYSAAQSKKAGRNLPLRTGWAEVKLQVMEDCLRSKFSDRALASKLLETKGMTLIEGNWWNDHYWGVCKGEGKNHLGKLLMKVRDGVN